MKAIIETENLTKYYGKTLGVKDLNLEIGEGEIFGFLGPNGAGKTTTIRLMMNFIKPTSGAISISGLDVQKKSVEIKKKVGYVAGDFRLYEKLTGREHIKYIKRFRGAIREDFLSELLEKFDFDPSQKVKHLSKGNKQKLAVILSLMHQPEILILDEPTTGLDPLLQNTVYEILKSMKNEGATVFLSSHFLPEVERTADRVGIIREGELISIETIKDLAEKRLYTVEVRFRSAYQKSEFKFEGVEFIEEISDGLRMKVRGDINPLMKKLSQYNLHSLEIYHATLEDIFLEYYGRE